MDKSIMEKLREPFPPEQIEWRVQSCGVANGNPWVRVLAYVQARAIQERLDEVFGWDNWYDEYRHTNTDCICRLSVNYGGKLVYKENGASNTDIEAFKGGISGAFKRVAASGYGIGRYLYNLEEGFAECTLTKPANMNGWNKAKAKDKTLIYWKIPTLPAWALPKGTQPPQTTPPKTSTTPATDNFCADCKEPVVAAVVTYCKNNGFDDTYCRKCQPKYKKQSA